MRRSLLVMFVFALLSACGSDERPGANTTSPGATSPADMADMLDQDQPDLSDAAPDQPSEEMGDDMSAAPDQDAPHDLSDDADMREPQEDMTHDADMLDPTDMVDEADMLDPIDMDAPRDMDMVVDMTPAPDYSGRPRGQCVSTADCGHPDLLCNREAVGGACQGPCSACASLPGSFDCEFGSCLRECSTTDDCEPGRSCNSAGQCVIMRCVNNVCPVALFGCASPTGICVRVSCAQGESCPAGTRCDRGVCIEDHIRP